MKVLSGILDAISQRREAARQARVGAEVEASAMLARCSRRQALHELRKQEAAAADPMLRQRIRETREAVFRLSRGEVRLDTATRMLYRDKL